MGYEWLCSLKINLPPGFQLLWFPFLGPPFLFDCGQWRDVTSNFLKERHPQFVVCYVTYKSFTLRHQHPLYDLVSVALMVIAVVWSSDSGITNSRPLTSNLTCVKKSKEHLNNYARK